MAAVIKVFDGVTGLQLPGPIGNFTAFGASFKGGAFVAGGDVNGDGNEDVIVSADAGGAPLVKVFSGANGSELLSFMPYVSTFRGGVRVAVADFDNDGDVEIVTAPASTGNTRVRVFDGTGTPFMSAAVPNFDNDFVAEPNSSTGGVFVAAGDVTGDGRADIVTGVGLNGPPRVKTYDGNNGALLASFLAYGANFSGGVRVATADVNGDGRADIVTGPGAGTGPNARAFDGVSLGLLDSFLAFGPGFLGGVFVGGRRV